MFPLLTDLDMNGNKIQNAIIEQLSADMNANSKKITNLAAPVGANDAARKADVDAAIVGLLDLKGDQDCSANPNYPAGTKGDVYYVTVAGKIGGASGKTVDIGDQIICKADNAGGTEASVGASWFVAEGNLEQATESARGTAELATQAEVDAGTDDLRIVTSLKLATNPRLPSQGENDALVGTSGTASSSNKYVTDADSRMTNSRTPVSHASSHQHGGADEIATSTAAANAIPKADGSGTLDTWVTDASESAKGKVELATAAEAEAKSSNSLAVTPAAIAAFGVKKSFIITGNGALTSFSVTHNLNTRDVSVQVYKNNNTTVYETVITDVERATVNACDIKFAAAPANLQEYRVVVVG